MTEATHTPAAQSAHFQTGFEYALATSTVNLGIVSNIFTGSGAPIVYFATLSWGREDIAAILRNGGLPHDPGSVELKEVIETTALESDYDRKIYGLLLQSTWFPLATGRSPQIALGNLIDRLNRNEVAKNLHMFRYLTEVVLDRWKAKNLRDNEIGEYKFHLDFTSLTLKP